MESNLELCDPRKHKRGIVDIVEMLQLIAGWLRPYNQTAHVFVERMLEQMGRKPPKYKLPWFLALFGASGRGSTARPRSMLDNPALFRSIPHQHRKIPRSMIVENIDYRFFSPDVTSLTHRILSPTGHDPVSHCPDLGLRRSKHQMSSGIGFNHWIDSVMTFLFSLPARRQQVRRRSDAPLIQRGGRPRKQSPPDLSALLHYEVICMDISALHRFFQDNDCVVNIVITGSAHTKNYTQFLLASGGRLHFHSTIHKKSKLKNQRHFFKIFKNPRSKHYCVDLDGLRDTISLILYAAYPTALPRQMSRPPRDGIQNPLSISVSIRYWGFDARSPNNDIRVDHHPNDIPSRIYRSGFSKI